MTRIEKVLCLLSAAALWQGCSSTGNSSDADTADGSVADTADGSVADTASDGPVVFLTRGMSYFKVTAVSGVSDGCMVDAPSFVDAVLPVNYVDATQVLSVGNLVGLPLQPTLGSGVVGVSGTLTRENDAAFEACSWHQKDVSLFNLTGGDIFMLDVTETQSAFIAACGTTAPASGTCTSLYTLTFAKTTAPADAGAGG